MPLPDGVTAVHALRAGFVCGYYSKFDLAAWAHEEIARQDEPSGEVLGLALVAHKNEQELTALLDAIVGTGDMRDEARLRIAFVARMLAEGRIDLGNALALLGRSALDDHLEPEERDAILRLESAHDLAAEGVYGTVEEVTRDFVAFAEPYERLLTPRDTQNVSAIT